MPILAGLVMPHPPIVVPEIGGSELTKARSTVEAMRAVGGKVKEIDPEVLVVISPHSPAFSEFFALKKSPSLRGSFAPFGFPSLTFFAQNDLNVVEAIFNSCKEQNLPVAFLEDKVYHSELDHGILVPYYYLPQEGHLVSASISGLSLDIHYQFGMAIATACEKIAEKVVFVASGDLSHRLIPGAPAGYSPRGAEFDLLVCDIIKKSAFEELLKLDLELINEAGECGLRSLVVLGGIVANKKVNTKILSYEGPFGVGYLVAIVNFKSSQ